MPAVFKFVKAVFLIILVSLFTLPVLAAEGDILLFDDFNDGNLNGWTIESGNWSVNNGNLFATQTGVFNFLGEIHSGSDWDNYSIELDVKNELGVDEGIEFRKQGGSAYTFNLRHGSGPNNTPEIKFFKTENNTAALVASFRNITLLNNIWYHIKIEALNDNIKLWVNDTLAFEYSDPGTNIKKGGIGLQSWTGANGFIRIRFDNIAVTALAPPPSPKTPLILIPGIGGSELKVVEDTVWNKDDGHGGVFNKAYSKDETVWVNEGEAIKPGNDDYFDVLRMKPDGINSEANIGVGESLVMRAYGDAINFFTSNGYELNKDFFVFPYDWRIDNTQNVSLLHQKIESIKSQTGKEKVDIIAHSMGGLISRAYISDPTKAQNVRKLFTLGTPHLGAVEFLKRLRFGGCLAYEFGPLCLSIAPSEVKDVMQNMISGFQLAPSQTYFNFYSGEDNQHPYPYRTELGAIDYIQIKNLLAILGHNISLFNPSESFHTVDSALPNTNGVDVTIIVGSGQSTLGQIIEEKTVSLLGIEDKQKDIRLINGDETVPLFSASLNDSSRNISLLGMAKVFYTNQEHSNLVSTGPALKLIKNNLDGNNELPTGVSTISFPLQDGLLFSVHSPVNIHVYDANSNHTGPTPDGDFEVNIPGSRYDTLGDAKFIYLPDSGNYSIKFKATDNGSFDFKIRKFENDENTETILYNDIPLTDTTKAEAEFDTNSNEPPILQVDNDGNGTIDTAVNSTSVLTGDAVDDLTPPQTEIQFSGTEGLNGWHKSDVMVTLNANDEEEGSGILKTEYTLDGQTINTYTGPFTVSAEAITRLKARSIDNAGNEEGPKEKEIKIDKTAPEAKVEFNLTNQNLEINGSEIIPGEVILQDEAGNTTKLQVEPKEKKRKEKLEIKTITYNEGSPGQLPDNKFEVKHKLDKKTAKLEDLDQIIKINGEEKVKAKYDKKGNITKIEVKVNKEKKQKIEKDGIVLLQLVTNNGQLEIKY